MSVCDYDLISRVALADVSGHGGEVDGVTQKLRNLMHENINAWDQSDFMRGVNETFRKSGDHKYATAIALSLHRVIGRLAFSNAGHLPPLWYHAAEGAWGWLEPASKPACPTQSKGRKTSAHFFLAGPGRNGRCFCEFLVTSRALRP